MANTSSNHNNVVTIDYASLLLDPNEDASSSTLHTCFDQAFGCKNQSHPLSIGEELITSSSHATPLGLIVIRNIPDFVNAKLSFLPQAHKLVHLPQSYLDENLTDVKSMYNAGWSHGKEKLGDNKPDFAKGSYYFNPVTDLPGTQEEREQYPCSYPCNVWPSEDRLPGFQDSAKQLGRLMKHVVVLLARHIDSYASKRTGNTISIGIEMENTEKVKGRLLYYFPLEQDPDLSTERNHDSWIGWHNDSGFLTALAGDLYVDHDTGEVIPRQDVDPNAGLYVMDRNGTTVKVDIPDDCMAIQIGECMQIVTGGAVVATPHCVRASQDTNRPGSKHVARISFPCFVDTVPSFPLCVPPNSTREQVLSSSVVGHCAKVPPLGERWVEDGMDFGSFLHKTFQMYYDWSIKNTKL